MAEARSAIFLGQRMSTSAVVNAPPMSGQSASMKHSMPRTGGRSVMPAEVSAATDKIDLLVDAGDEFGAVSAADHELLDPRPDDAALDA